MSRREKRGEREEGGQAVNRERVGGEGVCVIFAVDAFRRKI
jgi:hypothetical protein